MRAALALLALSVPAAAETCPIPGAPPPVVVEDLKDLPAHYWSHGTWFGMPLGYLNPQGPPEMIPILTDPARFAELLAANAGQTGYDAETGCFDPALLEGKYYGRPFTFWYPTGEYLAFDTGGTINMGRRPFTDCPDGTCDPKDPDDRFSVFVELEWGPGDVPPPADQDRMRQLTAWAERARRGEPQPSEMLANTEFSWRPPITGEKTYNIFDDDGQVITFMTCFHEETANRQANALCRGWFHDRETNVLAFVTFPFALGQLGTDERWRGPIGMIRTKIAEWTISDG